MRAALLSLLLLVVAGPAWAQGPATIEAYAGTWYGSYVATQGVTRMVVTVAPEAETAFAGQFIFFRDNATPDTPTGRYTTRGHFNPQDGRAWFDGDQWLEQPDNYAFVALSGVLDPDGTWKGEVFMDPYGDGPVRVGTFRLGRIF